MEDRFRFRAWDKRKNIYIKDFVFNFINKPPYITVEYFDDEYEYTHTFEEDEIIIEQCTGYRDCNGTPIFVGDICSVKGKVWDNEKNQYVKVNLIDTVMALEYFFSMLSNVYNYIATPTIKIEVIGNIHQNPELMKG